MTLQLVLAAETTWILKCGGTIPPLPFSRSSLLALIGPPQPACLDFVLCILFSYSHLVVLLTRFCLWHHGAFLPPLQFRFGHSAPACVQRVWSCNLFKNRLRISVRRSVTHDAVWECWECAVVVLCLREVKHGAEQELSSAAWLR